MTRKKAGMKRIRPRSFLWSVLCANSSSGATMKYGELTDRILGAFYRVYNTLGWGFSEKICHNALLHELKKSGLRVETQKQFNVFYDGVMVGEYFADVVVEGLVILELKAVEQLAPAHEAQLMNYLRASGVEVGLLLNFGPKPQCRRKVFDHPPTSVFPVGSIDNDDPADGLFQ
jgi:GxxExxY protein